MADTTTGQWAAVWQRGRERLAGALEARQREHERRAGTGSHDERSELVELKTQQLMEWMAEVTRDLLETHRQAGADVLLPLVRLERELQVAIDLGTPNEAVFDVVDALVAAGDAVELLELRQVDARPDTTRNWVPASVLAKNYGMDATQVRRFCDKHRVPTRPGRTKAGRQHPKRLEVDGQMFGSLWKAIEDGSMRVLDQLSENYTVVRGQKVTDSLLTRG